MGLRRREIALWGFLGGGTLRLHAPLGRRCLGLVFGGTLVALHSSMVNMRPESGRGPTGWPPKQGEEPQHPRIQGRLFGVPVVPAG